MVMEKAILYKEWLKTRAYCLLALIASCAMVAYCLLKMQYVISMKGMDHLWIVMMERDAVFIDRLTYMPLVVALLLAVVQFVPEMQQKRLKLTLHLPYPHFLNITMMLLWGTACLTLCFGLHFAGMWLYMRSIIQPEMYGHVLLTALPWYVAAYMAYYFTAWIVLEPTWKRRIVNTAIAIAATGVCFLSATPEAYNRMMPLLIVYTLLCFFLPMLSVQRFMEGRQD